MRLLLIVCAVLAAALAAVFLVARISARLELESIKPYATYKTLLYLATGCEDYHKQFGVWPESLEQLKLFREDLKETSRDAFGRDVVLLPYREPPGYGALMSYGKDGKPGGKAAADRDIEIRFPVESNAAWNKQVGLGMKEPRLRP